VADTAKWNEDKSKTSLPVGLVGLVDDRSISWLFDDEEFVVRNRTVQSLLDKQRMLIEKGRSRTVVFEEDKKEFASPKATKSLQQPPSLKKATSSTKLGSFFRLKGKKDSKEEQRQRITRKSSLKTVQEVEDELMVEETKGSRGRARSASTDSYSDLNNHRLMDLIEEEAEEDSSLSCAIELEKEFHRYTKEAQKQVERFKQEASELTRKIQLLEMEIQLKDKVDLSLHLCLVCKKEKKDYMFLPCGHLCVCSSCVRYQSVCPVCQEPASNVQEVLY
jgi:hypothetical protein